MATLHVSEAEAARDLPDLLARVRAGEEIEIVNGSEAIKLILIPAQRPDLFVPRYTQPRLISQILADLREKPSHVTLDDRFGSDLDEVIRQGQHDRLIDPWEAS